jgi:hypothetical protein
MEWFKKFILDSRLSEYILTALFSIVSTITFKQLDSSISFLKLKEWLTINNTFVWFLFADLIIVTILIINKYRAYIKEKKSKKKTEQEKQRVDILSAKLTEYEKEKQCLLKENNVLKDSYSFLTKDYYITIENILKNIFRGAKLTNDDRISIYRHIPQSKCFFMIGRFSQNSTYNEKGRMIYPDCKGYIGKAWNHDGDLKVKKIPDFNVSPDKYYEYIEKESGLSREVAEGLKMKGRYIFIRKLYKSDTVTPDMIVVFESMKEDRRNVIKKMEPHFEEIQHCINDYNPYEPTEEYAAQMGFGDPKLNKK